MPKARSPGYPAIGLKEAIEKVRLVYNKDYQNRVPKKVVAEHMGYKSLSGASLPILAALGKFGLLEGRGDETRVSDLALAIIAHEPGTPERIEAIKEAAAGPALFEELDEKFQRGKASDVAIRSYLLTQKYLPEAADTAIRAYRETKQLVEDESRGYSPAMPQDRAHEPLRPLPELGVPPAPPRTPSARSQGKDFMMTLMTDRIVLDGELSIREDIQMVIDRLEANKVFFPTRDERRASEKETHQTSPETGVDAAPHDASVPFMITQAQKTKLRQMGYDDEGISKMTPEMAHSLLGLISRN